MDCVLTTFARVTIPSRAYAIGSASQDYITNTHHKYFPCPQSKLVNIILGHADSDASKKPGILRPRPHISVQPDWMDLPYGIHSKYPLPLDRASHLALHPGMVQHRNHLLATVALNGRDYLDGFNASGAAGNLYSNLATNVILPLACDEIILCFPNGTTRQDVHIPATTEMEILLPVNTVVGVRVGRGLLAVRVFAFDSVNVANARDAYLALKSDALGLQLGAMRLVAYHLSGLHSPVPINNSHIRWGALMVADSTPACTALTDATRGTRSCGKRTADLLYLAERVASAEVSSFVDESSNTWHARAVLRQDNSGSRQQSQRADVNLLVVRDLGCSEKGAIRNQSIHTSWNCLVSRSVNGQEVVPVPLHVNGQPVVPDTT
eukprot:m.604307 g.604307  ORF g.604307 m.604307 type:complete len:379 (+) comp22459_c0_seq4:2006-3142(+)